MVLILQIKLMSEEIDDLSSNYQEFKDQNEEEVTFLRNKVVSFGEEVTQSNNDTLDITN